MRDGRINTPTHPHSPSKGASIKHHNPRNCALRTLLFEGKGLASQARGIGKTGGGVSFIEALLIFHENKRGLFSKSRHF